MTKDTVFLRKMQVTGWIVLTVMVIGSLLFVSLAFALSVLIGGVISLLSFMMAQRDVAGFIGSLPAGAGEAGSEKDEDVEKVGKSRKGFVVKFWVRLVVIGLALFLLIKSGHANILGLILGLSTVVFTIFFVGLSMAGHYLFNGRR